MVEFLLQPFSHPIEYHWLYKPNFIWNRRDFNQNKITATFRNHVISNPQPLPKHQFPTLHLKHIDRPVQAEIQRLGDSLLRCSIHDFFFLHPYEHFKLPLPYATIGVLSRLNFFVFSLYAISSLIIQ